MQDKQQSNIRKRRMGLVGRLGACILFSIVPATSPRAIEPAYSKTPQKIEITEREEEFIMREAIIAGIAYFGVLGAGVCAIYRSLREKDKEFL